MPCKHADKMMIYAKQAAKMDEPWKLWEWFEKGYGWSRCHKHPQWEEYNEYRQIQKTITININGHEVPEPMREKPEYQSTYYYIDTDADDAVCKSKWQNDKYDNRRFERRICHTTKEAVIAHAKALFSFTEVG